MTLSLIGGRGKLIFGSLGDRRGLADITRTPELLKSGVDTDIKEAGRRRKGERA